MSGEKKGDRAVIERVTARGIKSGMKPQDAHREAVESMKRVDRDRGERSR